MTQRVFNIPLGSAYDTRVSAVNAADGTSGYAGIGIAGQMIAGKTTTSTAKDARYINCFTQKIADPLTGKIQRIRLVKRPGWDTSLTPAAGSKGMDITIWKGQGNKIMSAFGDTNSTLYDAATSKGAITGAVTGFEETFVGTQATLLMSSTDSTGWYYDTAVGVATKISDADFPGNAGYTLAGKFVVLDGYPAIMTTDGKLWAGDLNTVTAWTATSFDSANSYSDLGIGAVRFKNFIMAFGTESVQFFYNGGLSPFPFAKAASMTQLVGCVAAKTITRIGDTVFWCGTTPQGGMSIFKYDGSLSRVSTPSVDSILILAGASNISLSAVRFYGLSLILAKAGSTTLAYCIEMDMWYEWNSTTPLWTAIASVSLGGTLVNYSVSNVSTAGKIWIMNQASLVFTDNADAYTATMQFPKSNEGTNNLKFYEQLDIVGDTEASTSILTVAYSDDDYVTRTTWGTVDMASGGGRLTRGGAARDRAFILTHAAATPMSIDMLHGRLRIGSS